MRQWLSNRNFNNSGPLCEKSSSFPNYLNNSIITQPPKPKPSQGMVHLQIHRRVRGDGRTVHPHNRSQFASPIEGSPYDTGYRCSSPNHGRHWRRRLDNPRIRIRQRVEIDVGLLVWRRERLGRRYRRIGVLSILQISAIN